MRAVLDWYNLLEREAKIPNREARQKMEANLVAFVPSSLVLSVTTVLSTDLAPVPHPGRAPSASAIV